MVSRCFSFVTHYLREYLGDPIKYHWYRHPGFKVTPDMDIESQNLEPVNKTDKMVALDFFAVCFPKYTKHLPIMAKLTNVFTEKDYVQIFDCLLVLSP